MIEKPGVELTVERATCWSAEGSLAERALDFAHRFCESVGVADCFRINVLSAAPQHVGLGTGTQLGLSIARALAELTEEHYWEQGIGILASRMGRGERSAVGIYGFQSAGFIVEAGKTADQDVSTRVFRADFPDEWSIVLVVPNDIKGVHGKREVETLAQLAEKKCDDRAIETLSRIVLLGMLPALFELDLVLFGEALYDFNRRSGAMFEDAQGGIYAHPRIEVVVRKIREMGIKGVGQSSWGPAIFAITAADQANTIRDQLVKSGVATQHEVIVSRAWNNPVRTVTQ